MFNNQHFLAGKLLPSRPLFLTAVSLLFFPVMVNAQFWTETFSNACASNCLANAYVGPNGTWTETNTGVNDPESNKWFVSGAECGNTPPACGTGCGAIDPSLHIGSDDGILPSDPGAAYNTGGICPLFACVATDMRVESPTINCTGQSTITLAFNYIENGDGTIDDATLWYFDGATWTQINALAKTSIACAPQGTWTAFSLVLPASANNNPNVKIGFRWVNNDDALGSDPSFAVDDITLTGTLANSITTGTIFSASYCPCDTINIPFTSTGTFLAGNTYTAELSSSTGSFATPTSIGTLSSVANSGTISAVIPCGAIPGTQYQIRVVSSSPSTIGTPNGVNFTVSGSIAALVNITASPSGTICFGQSVTFTANNVNSAPGVTYQWFVNGGPVGGATSSTFTSSTLANGNTVLCVMSSSSGCVTGSPATSNTITMSVSGVAVTADVTISATQNPICTGTLVTFTAVNVNGIPSPNYQWQINGGNVGTNSTTFSSTTLANGNIVTCIISSSGGCVTGSPATSNAIVMTVANTFIPQVFIGIAPNDTICAGDLVTLTATPLFGGISPTFAWAVNGSAVGGSGNTYSSSTFSNLDTVTVVLTSSLTCATSTATNGITIYVDPGGATGVTVVSAPTDTACPGQTITYTASSVNAGTNPTYQWFVNGAPVGTGIIYFSNTLNTGDVVTCQVTSSSNCTSGSPATSVPDTVLVATTLVAEVSVTSSEDTICLGDLVSFFATPVNGGDTPTYFWQVNGNVVATNITHYFDTTLQDGDVIVCVMISSDPCAYDGIPATSDSIVLRVDPCPVPVSIFNTEKSAICQGDCVNFMDYSENQPNYWHWVFEGGNPPEAWDQNPQNVCYSTPGVYSVQLFTSNFRGSHDTTFLGYITVDDPTPLNAGEDVEIKVGELVLLNATGGNMYLWTPSDGLTCSDCPNPVAAPGVSTFYVVSDTLGCPSQDTILVKVFKEFEIYVPNAFSPNGDGQNDILFVRGNGIVDLNFIVYDRLGERLFSSNTITDGWDGYFRGRPVNPGVYSYFVKASLGDGSSITDKGNVTVFK